jgi:hypothetical protein
MRPWLRTARPSALAFRPTVESLEDRAVPSAADVYVAEVTAINAATSAVVNEAAQAKERTVRVVTGIYQAQYQQFQDGVAAVAAQTNQVTQQAVDQITAINTTVVAQRQALQNALAVAEQQFKDNYGSALSDGVAATAAAAENPVTGVADSGYVWLVTQQKLEAMTAGYQRQVEQIGQGFALIQQVADANLKAVVTNLQAQFAQLQAAQQAMVAAFSQNQVALFDQARLQFEAIERKLQADLQTAQRALQAALEKYGVLFRLEAQAVPTPAPTYYSPSYTDTGYLDYGLVDYGYTDFGGPDYYGYPDYQGYSGSGRGYGYDESAPKSLA